MMNRLFCFGTGFTAQTLIKRLDPAKWHFAGTCRTPSKAIGLTQDGIDAYVFDGSRPIEDARSVFANISHVLVSIPPDVDGDRDRALMHHQSFLAGAAPHLRWIGYLSTVGVYGDHDGGWISETTPPAPVSRRGEARLAAERQWQAFGRKTGVPVQIFRLPGIYGPGRNALTALKRGKTRSIIKPGQVFNRIHVADLAAVLERAMAAPDKGPVFNVVDDEPAPPQDVTAYAARLMGLPAPEEVDFDSAEMSPMARSFYGECKRVHNTRIKQELGAQLAYPDYRAGLDALWREEPEAEGGAR
ncbi:MAG: NAD(P)-dependent oxidoreductase [Hyphomicrobiales bacterium]|nr:MAG: NAD(P)-dependent oxidoreductase [Hyphomicrobiales bacterium]